MLKMRIWFWGLMVALLSGTAEGTVFPCSEAGLDGAIAAAENGDPGPHSLSCTSGDTIQISESRTFVGDLTLDGRGVTIECTEISRPSCRAFYLATLPSCSYRICYPEEYHERSTIELRDFRLNNGVWVYPPTDAILRNSDLSSSVRLLARGDVEPGTLHVVDSSISGIWVDAGILDLVDSTISGVRVRAGRATIEGSTINEGTLPRYPLAVGYLVDGRSDAEVELINSTVNGGIWNSGTLTMVNSTIVAPVSGTAYQDLVWVDCADEFRVVLAASAGHATSTNTIVQGFCSVGVNPDEIPPGCSEFVFPPPGTMTSLGGNVQQDDQGGGSCGFIDATDQSGVTSDDLALGPLAYNGGPTQTRALQSHSIAVDAGILENCPLADQRGEPRPELGGVACDAGAFELPEPEPALLGAVALCTLIALRRIKSARCTIP